MASRELQSFSAERGDCRSPLTPALTSVSSFSSFQTPHEPLWAWQWPWNSFLQSTSDFLRLVLFSFQEPAVHLVAPVQMENNRVPCDRPRSGFGGSILLCSTGKLFSIRIMFNAVVWIVFWSKNVLLNYNGQVAVIWWFFFLWRHAPGVEILTRNEPGGTLLSLCHGFSQIAKAIWHNASW